MTGRHRALVVFVRLSIRTRLRPGDAMRVVKQLDHAMHEIVGPGYLLVGGRHRFILTVQFSLQLLIEGCTDEGRRFDGKKDAAGENRIDKPAGISHHGVLDPKWFLTS